MNTAVIEGFTSFSKVDRFQDGRFRHRFSMTLQAGKDREGSYRKEFLDVRLSGEINQTLPYKGDGTRIKVKGRMRCEPWVDKNTQQKRKSIFLEAFEAKIIADPTQQYQQAPAQQQYQQPPAPPAQQYQQAPVQQQPPAQQYQGGVAAPTAPLAPEAPNMDDIPF